MNKIVRHAQGYKCFIQDPESRVKKETGYHQEYKSLLVEIIKKVGLENFKDMDIETCEMNNLREYVQCAKHSCKKYLKTHRIFCSYGAVVLESGRLDADFVVMNLNKVQREGFEDEVDREVFYVLKTKEEGDIQSVLAYYVNDFSCARNYLERRFAIDHL